MSLPATIRASGLLDGVIYLPCISATSAARDRARSIRRTPRMTFFAAPAPITGATGPTETSFDFADDVEFED